MLERENTVAIIGGLGKMGVVTRRLFEQTGHPVIISDIKDPATHSAREAIREAGIVFFSVLPIENIGDIIRSTADLFGEEHRVLDNASVKNPLQRGYEVLNEKGASICSTHPLCKDDQPFFGQTVFIAPFGNKPQPATVVAEQIYQKAGMVLMRIDFHEHDSLTTLTQLLPHMANRAIGLVLALHGAKQDAIDAIATANFRLFNLATWRTLVQEPQISATLIRNLLKQPEGQKIVDDLQAAIARIVGESAEEGSLEKTFRETVDLLDPSGTVRVTMNDRTIVVLERLVNLQLHSITIDVDDDYPGLLRKVLEPFERAGINLSATDSHLTEKGGVRFHLGISSGQITDTLIQELNNLGFRVSSVTTS